LVRRGKIRELVVFGDSFSDVGNIFRASNGTQPPSPPYFRGRYSNGRNYVDFLGEALGLKVSTDNDYAWGGATTDNHLVPGVSTFLNATVPSLQEQVRTYLSESNASSRCGEEAHNTRDHFGGTILYVVLIGYNDYWWYANQNVTENTTRSDMEVFVDRVISSMMGNVQDLVADGCPGGMVTAAVGNLPPMDLLPDAATKTPTVLRAYQELTRLHNAKLSSELLGLEKNTDDRPRIRLFPVHETISELAAYASCLGFGNVSVACLSTNNDVCDDPYRHLFWDDWHPMTWTHQRLARVVLSAATE
jgi:phospholipase/lecithinase/hemolysin